MLLPIVHLTDYASSLCTYALRLTRNRADADELVQETYLHALQAKRKPFHAEEYPRWLTRILRNCHVDRVRRRACRPERLLEDDVLDEFVAPATADAVELEHVDAVLAGLPESRGNIIQLRLQGFTYQEIAGVLRMPLGTVMSSLHYARQQMKNALAKPL